MAEAYHVYVKENTKELIVEPAIRVLPLEEEEGASAALHAQDKKQLKQADVCHYKILPLVNNNLHNGTGENNVEDLPDEQGLKRHRSPRTRLEEGEDYPEDQDEEEEEEEPNHELPFTIRPSKENKHEAVLQTTTNLNCEHKASYEFDIVAVSCAGHVSQR